jgi:hypothetical protein
MTDNIITRLRNYDSAQLLELLNNAADEIERAYNRAARLEIAIARVVNAIENEGPRPAHHQRVMSQHRTEWSTLWRELDNLLEQFYN